LPEIDADGCNGCLRQRIEMERFGNGILAGIWVEEILKTKNYVRESKWSQSIAVGSKSFVEGIKEKLGILAKGRKVGESGADKQNTLHVSKSRNNLFIPFLVQGAF
jgi:hypothetical protein